MLISVKRIPNKLILASFEIAFTLGRIADGAFESVEKQIVRCGNLDVEGGAGEVGDDL